MQAALDIARASMGPAHQVGQLIGCSVDASAWVAHCEVPLFPGQWNEWLLVRQVDDDPEVQSLPRRARNALRFWFRESAALPGFSMGHAEGVEAAHIGSGTGGIAGAEVTARALAERPIASTLSTRCGLMFEGEPVGIEGQGWAMMRVKFVYRGARGSMGWPAAREATRLPVLVPDTLTGTWCPVNADWMLVAALEPDRERAVPAPEKGPGDILRDVGETAGRITLAVQLTLALAGVGIGAYLLWRLFK